LVWLRLAMAKFGVTTALISTVLSVFMAGLGAGSWIAGVLMRRYGERLRSPLRLYGLIELAIGISALVVPLELEWGSRVLESIAGSASVSSGSFYVLSGLWLAITLVPWCACMGATIPVAMFAIGKHPRGETQRSFSLLYLANVIGAVGGACVAPILIEMYGFHGTLRVGAALNAVIFVAATLIAAAFRETTKPGELPVLSTDPKTAMESISHQPSAVSYRWVIEPGGSRLAARSLPYSNNSALLLLFTTGLTTMGMEVVWIRLYTVFLGPVVYSFAAILASYLGATFIGSKIYRVWSRRHEGDLRLLWISLAFFCLLPLVTADPRIATHYQFWRVIVGIAPGAGIIGFLTPMLVDRWSGGDPDRAGRAYAINVAGCILGPLLAGFVLLPLFSEHVAMLILVLPWFGMALLGNRREPTGLRLAATAAILIGAITIFFFAKDYESVDKRAVILRDSTATVLATGSGMQKELLVNGIGMTILTPLTKIMVHLPLAELSRPPRNVLIICFGMGTSFRSAMSWGVPVTVVELVPSVPKLFTFYHPDSGPLLSSPRAHIVIDDGRRYLDRSTEKFDAIIIDPPPPINAAGSSLLYTREFYTLIRNHLAPDGILQQWFFIGDSADKAAHARAITGVFPYVRAFHAMEGGDCYHFLASMMPIPRRTGEELLVRMPPAAVMDLLEWGPANVAQDEWKLVLAGEVSPEALIALSPNTPELEDDRPINEYDALRKSFAKKVEAAAPVR
jgi:spermidine synthase